MAVVSVRVTEEGILLPDHIVRELGLQPGEEVQLDVQRTVDAETTRLAALKYCWRKLGDVEQPWLRWSGRYRDGGS